MQFNKYFLINKTFGILGDWKRQWKKNIIAFPYFFVNCIFCNLDNSLDNSFFNIHNKKFYDRKN